MPVFNLATEKPLPTKKRAELAMMFTDVHCENTDAPNIETTAHTHRPRERDRLLWFRPGRLNIVGLVESLH